jgi:putative NADH-flavin reductase
VPRREVGSILDRELRDFQADAFGRGYEVVGVCRGQSVSKLERFEGRMTIVPGATNDPEVIAVAVAGCDGVLTVLVPWG